MQFFHKMMAYIQEMEAYIRKAEGKRIPSPGGEGRVRGLSLASRKN